MRLNQRQIEVFNAIMVHKSVTAAAASLRTSQPTVSRELRDLERQIGFDLFNRFGKRLTPTTQAQLLHSVVARSFVGMEEISRAAAAIKEHNAAQLRIASIPAYAEAFLPIVANRFMKEHGPIHLSVHSLEEVSLRHDLTTHMFDIGLTEGSYDYDDATTERIDLGEVVCVLPAGHRLTSKTSLAPKDFEGVEFVYFTQEDPYRSKLDEIFDKAGVSRRYIVETTTATGVCSMVTAGLGVSIVNPLTAAHYTGRGIVLRKLSIRVPYYLNLWRPAKSLRSTHADQFVQTMHQVAGEITQRLKISLSRQDLSA